MGYVLQLYLETSLQECSSLFKTTVLHRQVVTIINIAIECIIQYKKSIKNTVIRTGTLEFLTYM